MEKIVLPEIKLIGLSLTNKTTNANGQSAIDCGSHWQKFESGNYLEKIPGKTSDEIFAVYHEYEGDHLSPYAYFIGCRISDHAETPEGINSLLIPRLIM